MKKATWIETLGLGVAAVAVVFAVACSKSEEASASESTQQAPVAEPQDNAAKKVQIKVTASGYEPDSVQAEAGKPITLVFTRVTDEGCGNKVVLPDFNIERDLPLNQPVEITITPQRAGEFRITCGMKMFKGKIVVR